MENVISSLASLRKSYTTSHSLLAVSSVFRNRRRKAVFLFLQLQKQIWIQKGLRHQTPVMFMELIKVLKAGFSLVHARSRREGYCPQSILSSSWAQPTDGAEFHWIPSKQNTDTKQKQAALLRGNGSSLLNQLGTCFQRLHLVSLKNEQASRKQKSIFNSILQSITLALRLQLAHM